MSHNSRRRVRHHAGTRWRQMQFNSSSGHQRRSGKRRKKPFLEAPKRETDAPKLEDMKSWRRLLARRCSMVLRRPSYSSGHTPTLHSQSSKDSSSCTSLLWYGS
ncbi:hypothetical protein M758_12G050900 [Ceratodon purpureus]|uniref:Uncharacterized protein n=1 Tax=Ceratodon purpureus TaxID=3225 RepID=A0A8T0G4S5_CERPU|nr:hypothetical protein KC19_12G048300 [Ceratodon purpureus]KAG0598156.1 hypothetical protein M758_12G050900 [Ceratodon purpureus]